ncbi:MAG: hypothetical protein PHX56_07390 [Atribacterota bacterium]|nr:hypothetical protein [Atribacterota bacterium]
MGWKDKKKSSTDWYIHNWTFLGWVETIIKTIAIIIGILSFYLSFDSQDWVIPSGVQLVQLLVLGLLSLGIFFAIFNRWKNKEIISMFFVILNNIGHWGMFLSLLRDTGWFYLPYFALLMMLGDLVKILFLKQTGYTERNILPSLFIYATLVFVIGYGLIDLFSCLN